MIHVVGALGMLLVLGAYGLVSTHRVRSASVAFQGTNLVGAALLTWYSFALGAYATVVLNAVWGLIALVALLRLRSARRPGG